MQFALKKKCAVKVAKCTINVATTEFLELQLLWKGSCSRKAFYLPFSLSSHLYYSCPHRQVLELTRNSFFKRVISAVCFSYCSPPALRPRPDRPFECMIGPPARCWSLLRVGLRSPELLRVINVMNGLYKSNVSMAERQEAGTAQIHYCPPFDSFSRLIFFSFLNTSVWLVLYATLSPPVQLALTGL